MTPDTVRARHVVVHRTSDLQPVQGSESAFRPYYLIERASSDSPVRKFDLFSQKQRILSKVRYSGAPPKAGAGWELDVDPALSYVYDKRLRFGVAHSFKDNVWVPESMVGNDAASPSELPFARVEQKDPLKASILQQFHSYTTQPIPRVDPKALGFSTSDFSEEEYYKARTLSRISNLPLHETYRNRTVSEWIRGMLNTCYRDNNILIPNTDELRLGSTKQYVTGALTLEPESGTYFKMGARFRITIPGRLDVFNLSYKTIRCPHLDCKHNIVPGLDYHVCRRRGIYSAMVGALRDLRIRHFRPLTRTLKRDSQEYKVVDAATQILKLLVVSSYGVTIRIHDLASPLLGEAITAYGRHVLQTTFDMAREKGLSPKYGDTDSVFLDNPSEHDVQQSIREVEDRFGLEPSYERRYAVCVLSAAKKAYLGILSDGRPEIKGLTVSKSNSPRFFLETFENCLAKLSEGRDSPQSFEKAKGELQGIIKASLYRLRHRDVPLADLGTESSSGKTR